MEPQYETLGAELQRALIAYKESHPRRSITGLANELVGKTTLNKAYNGKSQDPTEQTVVGAVTEMNKGRLNSDDKSWNEMALTYKDEYPKMYEVLKKYGEKHYKSNTDHKFTSGGFEEALKNEDVFRAVIMSQADDGISKTRIEKLFGWEVLRTIEDLVAREVLIEKDGIIHGPKEILNFQQETTYALTRNILKKCYNIEAFGTGIGNELRLDYWTDVNKEYLKPRISEIIIRCIGEIRSLLDDPKAKGEDTMWVIAAMDALLKSPMPPDQGEGKLQ